MMKNQKPGKRYERCVCCGAETDVPEDMEIDRRRFYLIGAGQLCPKCYGDLKPEMDASDRRIAEGIQR